MSGKTGRQNEQKAPNRQTLRADILKLLASRAFDKVEISNALNLPSSGRSQLRELLREMEAAGDITLVRKNRYAKPDKADLFTGTIQFHANGSAHVLAEKPGQSDLLINGENTWPAMHGDRVAARIGRSGREGTVVSVLERANETIVGTLQKSKNSFHVEADDARFAHSLHVEAPKPPLDAQVGDKVVAHIDKWPTSRDALLEGHIIEVLGAAGSPGVDMLSIIRKHRLPTKFPPDVQREAEAISPEVDPVEAASREDLRGKFIVTIDPDDAKDFDDAIHVETTSEGWRVGIHIADVSHYVRPNSALDREALARGNSVYLADRVIPMLPEALSNGICSLKPQVDRLAFSVFAEISHNGKAHSVRFAKTVIRSAVRLTYKQAFEILQKPANGDPLGERLHTAWELASLLRKKRFEHGSLELDFPEVKVWLDEQGVPIRLEKIENDISHQLIEEFMLLANELVARELKLRRQPAVYRVHEKPDPEKLNEFREFAATFGVRTGDLTNRKELQKLLASLRGKPFEFAVKIALLKSLKRARYLSDPLGHFGLHKPDYTHFTSPIRRYSDLIVHRAMEFLCGRTKAGPDSRSLASTAEHISMTERTASDAEKESVRMKKLEFFQNQIAKRTGQVFLARILEVRNFGLFVELPDFLLSGLVHVSSLDKDYYILDTAKQQLVGRKSRKIYRAGDEIEVIVARVDTFKQQVDFKPA